MIPEWNIEAMRSKLIEDDLSDLSNDDLVSIVEEHWQEFEPLAVRWLDKKWSDGNDVFEEAVERGYTRWVAPDPW